MGNKSAVNAPRRPPEARIADSRRTKKKVAEKATFLALPMATQDQGAAGQIWGGMGGHPSGRHPNAAPPPGFRLAVGFFAKSFSGHMPETTTPAQAPASGGSWEALALLPVLLDARGAQAGEAMAVDRVLPGQEFLDSERIAAASLFKRKEAATHRRNDFRLAANHPALRSRRRQVGDRKRTSIGPDDVLHPRAVGLVHGTLTHFKIADARLTRSEFTLCDLRFS
jgi:hypothetical protein